MQKQIITQQNSSSLLTSKGRLVSICLKVVYLKVLLDLTDVQPNEKWKWPKHTKAHKIYSRPKIYKSTHNKLHFTYVLVKKGPH